MSKRERERCNTTPVVTKEECGRERERERAIVRARERGGEGGREKESE